MAKNLPKNLQTGLVLWLDWTVDGTTARDVSGSLNNGTTVGSPTTQRVVQNKGFVLNGSSQYVNTNFVPQFWTVSFTMSVWIKTSTSQADKRIFWCYNAWSTPNTILHIISHDPAIASNNRIWHELRCSNNIVALLNYGTYPINDWQYHLATIVVNRTTNFVHAYLDGWLVLSTAVTFTGTFTADTRPSTVWAILAPTATSFWAGNAVNPMIWYRDLSHTEVQQLHKATYIK